MKKIFFGVAAVVCAAFVARADTVILKNGDHLTGTIVKSDGKVLTLKTDYAGDLNIDWTKVQELTTEKPLYIVTPDKQVVSGTVTTQGADLIVATSNAGAVHVPI